MNYLTSKRATVLVVGAGGFLGTHVTRALLEANFTVRTLAPQDIADPRITHFKGRTTNSDIVRAALAGCDRVIYLAGQSTPGHAVTMRGQAGCEFTALISLAEFAVLAGCRQFIFTSSGGTVYGTTAAAVITEEHELRPISTYGVNMAVAEQSLRRLSRRDGMAVLILRVANPYGPGQRLKRNQGLVAAAMEAAYCGTALPVWGDGSTVRDYIYIDDVANAYAAACHREPINGTLNIASAKGTSITAICRLVERATSRIIDLRYEPGRAVDIARNVLSVSRAREVLQWQPETPLETGIGYTKDWWVQTADDFSPRIAAHSNLDLEMQRA